MFLHFSLPEYNKKENILGSYETHIFYYYVRKNHQVPQIPQKI